jgi:hypothetical protein
MIRPVPAVCLIDRAAAGGLAGRREPMGKVVAGITISVDGFITGPGDGPGCGLGVGGERLHYWVFGGPWSYDSSGRFASGAVYLRYRPKSA